MSRSVLAPSTVADSPVLGIVVRETAGVDAVRMLAVESVEVAWPLWSPLLVGAEGVPKALTTDVEEQQFIVCSGEGK